jgi:riboflavin kinase/FMN adenylyltransferase
MKIICGHPSFPTVRHSYAPIPYRKISCVATIGVFDGIHRGHMFILKKVIAEARRKRVGSLVITFDIPPQMLLKKPFAGCISSLTEKESLFKAQGINYTWLLTTTKHLLKLSAEEFLNYIFKYFAITTLFVGEGFKFGRNGRAGIDELETLSRKYHFKLVVVRKRRLQGKIISSSLIRECILKAQFARVAKLLGRNYLLEGKVIAGRGVGRQLGFPTANIEATNRVIPLKGVYAAVACGNSLIKLAAVNIGTNPTITKSQKLSIEAHLIGFNGNIVGKNIKILFLRKLRTEKKFPSRELLTSAITNDINTIIKKYQFIYEKCLKNRFSPSSKCSTPSRR